MNLYEYQEKARSTAMYLDRQSTAMIYPALGIIGECGEVAEKIKKMIRDDNWEMTKERKNDIKKELGDCCWYLANICCDTNHDLSMMYDMRGHSILQKVRSLIIQRIVLHMSRHAIGLATALEDWCYSKDCRPSERDRYTEIPHHLSHIITCIEEIGRRCDFTLEDICVSNIEKLLSRKSRGTLKGSGDNR